MGKAVTFPLFAFAAALIFVGAPSNPSEFLPGPVSARVVHVIDGDTIVVRARIWLFQDIETRVRLTGADAPELNGSCELERRLALSARDMAKYLVGAGDVVLHNIHYGKYAGRVVARVSTADGIDISDSLMAAGLARAYDGGKRRSWCRAEGSDGPAP